MISRIDPSTSGIAGGLGYAALALLILFSPRAFAQPVPAPGLEGAVQTVTHRAETM